MTGILKEGCLSRGQRGTVEELIRIKMTSQLERLSVACMGSRLQEPFLFRVDVVLGAAFLEDFDPFTWVWSDLRD